MAIDPGIFAQSGKPSVALDDPSDQLQKLMAVQGQVNANKLFQGQSAAGAAAQAATDPVTGQVDQNKLNRLLASNPSIAPAAMQALQQGNAIGGAQTDNQSKRRAAVAQQAVSLLTMSDAQLEGGQALHDQLDSELKSGLMDQATHDAVVRAAPPLGSSAATVRQFLRQAAVGGMSGPEALGAAVGSPDMQGNGQVNQPGLRAGVANPVAPGSFTPSGPGIGQVLTPSQKTSQVTRIGPNGEEITETLGTRLGQQGDTQFLGGQSGGKAFPAGLVPQGYTGRHPGNTSPGAVPGAPAVAPVAPGGAVVTSLAPGAREAAIATSAASAEQGVNLQKAADGSTDRHAMLTNMESDLNGFTSGPLAERQKNYSAFVNRNLPVLSGLIPGVQSNQSVAAQEQFEKMAKQIALAQSGSLGSTDAKLETSLGANPNSGLSQLGNKQIIAMLHGNEDAITAKNQAWQQYQATNGAGAYGKFSNDFNKNFDPRVYQLMRMDPADARRITTEMGDTRYAALKVKADAMEKAGLVSFPGRGTAQPAQQQAQPGPGLEPSQMPGMTPPPAFGGPPNRLMAR